MEGLRSFFKHLADFEEEELDGLPDYFRETEIARDEFFVKEDEVCKKAAFIKKGLFKLFYTQDGIERIMLFFMENQFVTDYYSFLTQTPSKRPVQAMEDSVIYTVSYNDFHRLLNSSMKWGRAGRLLAERAYVFSVQRANRIIQDDPGTRFMTFLKEYPTLIQRVPQYMIASYLNMTPETYSRVKRRVNLKDLEKFSSIHDPIQRDFI